MFGESFRALFENAQVSLESVVQTTSLASSLALAVDHEVAFWAANSDAFTVNHRELSRTSNLLALSIDLGVTFRALLEDALVSVHGISFRTSF